MLCLAPVILPHKDRLSAVTLCIGVHVQVNEALGALAGHWLMR